MNLLIKILDKMSDIERNNKKLLDRILSITKRNNENSVKKQKI